jgi:hypothetical protein
MVIILLSGLMWANAILINRGHPISGTLLSLLLVPTIGLPVLKGSLLVGHRFVEWQYKAQGLELVHGCNALAANMASFDVFIVRERLAELKDSPNADSNQIVRVENAYTAAQEKARILSDDCRGEGIARITHGKAIGTPSNRCLPLPDRCIKDAPSSIRLYPSLLHSRC